MGSYLKKTFNILTVCTVLYTPLSAQAASRCTADLQRIDLTNCLSRSKQQHSYQWNLTDQTFNVEVNACINDASSVGTHRDIVIGIDRSASNLIPDKQRKKLRADAISASIDLINHLSDQYKSNPSDAPNVSLVMFSSDDTCREYQGSKITFTGEFPCLYTRAAKVTDSTHKTRLLEFLTAAEDKYSAGSSSSASNFDMLANLVRDRVVTAAEGRQSGIALFTTGLSYQGVDGDVYAFLKSNNYDVSYLANNNAFSNDVVRKSRLVVMSAPLSKPYYSDAYRDSFENMCALPDRPSADCAATSASAPTWLVNKFDVQKQLTMLAQHSGGIVRESSKASAGVDLASDMLINSAHTVLPEQVTLTIDGTASDRVSVSGERISIQGLDAGRALNVQLSVYANGEAIPFDFALSTEIVPGAELDFTDREMFCAADTANVAKLSLKDMQGGSGSCGVAGVETTGSRTTLVFLFMPVLLVLLGRRAKGLLVATLAFASVSWANSASAEEKITGLNSQHFRPIVDGVGNTESAVVINPGTYNIGIFGDYANDPVEIGGEKGRRVRGVTDNMMTAHVTGNIGLLDRVSVGIHVPYVHKTDVDREVNGESIERGNVGQPADSAIFAKINIMRRQTWALAFIPQYTLTTGNSDYLIGDGTSNYGASVALSGSSGSFLWATNIGYLYRQDPLVLSDDRTNDLKVTGFGILSAGGQYRISSVFSAGGNIFGKFHSGERFDFNRTNPAEWQALGKMKIASVLEGSLGFGTGIGKGYGAPDYRIVVGCTYVPASTRTTVRQVAGPQPTAKR